MRTSLERVFVLTGAGISAESGIPTFRGKEGYWQNLDPKQLAKAKAFRKHPESIWRWYRHRRDLIRRSEPNAAHQAVVKLAANSRAFLLVTQNVDNLHARAEWEGQRLAPGQIVQIHGDIFVTHCFRCDFKRRETDEDSSGVPRCPKCGGMMRPGVIWFDEKLARFQSQRVKTFLRNGACDPVLVIGTTAAFPYIRKWVLAAKGKGGALIEINPEKTPLSQFATEVIRAPAAQALPQLVTRLVDRVNDRLPYPARRLKEEDSSSTGESAKAVNAKRLRR
jgi:NAD-dependent deacetylase